MVVPSAVTSRLTGEDPMIAGEPLQLLTPKILPPRSPAGLVERPRLIGSIDQVQARQSTVIRGRAGSARPQDTLRQTPVRA
jgi:hypothetical protein